MRYDMIIEHELLQLFAELINTGKVAPAEPPFHIGVDLGTSNIVMAIVDQYNHPVAGMTMPSTVVKDGIVVDYMGAVNILRKMKCALEKRIGVEINVASTAIPPGILPGNERCIVNCVESADMEVIQVVDEPTAAASVLDITEGAVVDIGGGTTGISVLEKGQVVHTADEATGGTHMTLVLAGYHHVSFSEAEQLKKDETNKDTILSLIRPVIEKMAMITAQSIEGYAVQKLYLVGGACSFTGFEHIFERILHIPTYKTNHSLFVTPLGIAMQQKIGG